MQHKENTQQNVVNSQLQIGQDAQTQQEEELDLRELLQKINRRRMTIAGIFILVVAVTWLGLAQATPRFTAHSALVLEFHRGSLLNLEDMFLGGGWTNPSVIGTELDIIMSTSLLEKVADELDLARNPMFNPALRENDDQGWGFSPGQWVRELWEKHFGPEEEPAAEILDIDPLVQEQRLKRSIIAQLRGGLSVENHRESHTLIISYTSEDPVVAAKVANMVSEMYINDQLEAKFEATRRANEWLARRLENLRMEVQYAEQAVKDVRQQRDLIQAGGGRTILQQQVSDVNAQLIQARINRSRAESRMNRAREIMDQDGGIESLGEVMESRTIQQLRSEESSLRRKRAELAQRYGPRHPQMIQVQAEMEDLEAKLREEIHRIMESLENDVQSARAEERSLERSLNQLRIEAGQAMEAELHIRELERQAESARVLYENYLMRFQEAREKDDLQRPDARVISPAEVPDFPSHPRKNRTMTLGMAAGLMFGVMGAFLLETLDKGFRTREQVENTTGVPVFGMIPNVPRGQGYPDEFIIKKPHSGMAEALRAVRAAIHLSNVDNPPKTVLVTSSVPMEGKSSMCVTMGHVAALSGTRTLLIDADLRLAAVQKRVTADLPSKSRLEDVLQGSAELEEAVNVDKRSGLHLLLAHGKTPTAGDLLGSKRMADLLKKVSQMYDLIIVDTPPVTGVADAWTLSRSVDSVIYAVRWSETPRDMVRSCLRQMSHMGIRVNGIVLTRVDVRQQSKYGYTGYGYYYGKYKKSYYHE